MAATAAELAERIDASLNEIQAEAEFLPELAAGWDAEHPVNRDVWYLEWRELMARLSGLERDYCAGLMTARQQKQYSALRRLLAQRLPLLRQMGLPLPADALCE